MQRRQGCQTDVFTYTARSVQVEKGRMAQGFAALGGMRLQAFQLEDHLHSSDGSMREVIGSVYAALREMQHSQVIVDLLLVTLLGVFGNEAVDYEY